MKERKPGLEEFNLDHRPEITERTIHARPGCILVAVRDYNDMTHLQNVLRKTNLRRHDIAVMTVRPVMAGAGEYELLDNQLFADYEKELFTRVVAMAEREGKTVDLLVVPGVDPFDTLVQTAEKVKASRLVTGVSPRVESDDLARQIGLAWEKLPEPRRPFSHLWLRLSERCGGKLHHRDVVGVELRRLECELQGPHCDDALEDLIRELRHQAPTKPEPHKNGVPPR